MNWTIQASLVMVFSLVAAAGCGAAEGVDEHIGSESEAVLAGGIGLGSFSNGKWYFDTSADGVFGAGDWTAPSSFGQDGDIPVLGYGAGHTCGSGDITIGVFRPSNGTFYLDINHNFMWDAGDKVSNFAVPFVGINSHPFIWTRKVGATCQGVVGIGLYAGGGDLLWFVDLNDNGILDNGENIGTFGGGNQLPAPIWSVAQNSSVMTVFDLNSGAWYVDTNNNKTFDGCVTDACTTFGQPGDVPISNSGSTKRGVTRVNSARFIDGNSNGWWDGTPADGFYAWRTNELWAFIWGG